MDADETKPPPSEPAAQAGPEAPPRPARLGFWRLLRIRLAAVWWFIVGAAFLLSLPVLIDISPWAPLALALLAIVLAALFVLTHDQTKGMAGVWVRSAIGLLLLLSILIAAPFYYLAGVTALRPAIAPQVVLTNGVKTVVFQGMMHVGVESFYKSVVYDLQQALGDGYVLYYEGVSPSPGEGDQWFNQYLAGGRDLSLNYKDLAEMCGLVYQLDYFSLLAADMVAHPERHVAADVNTLDMKREFDRLMQSDPAFGVAMRKYRQEEAARAKSGGVDTLEGFVRWQQAGTESQKALGGVVCRGVMTRVAGASAYGRAAPSEIDKVILDFRNQSLAQRIQIETRPLIYVTYGERHLPGVIAELKKRDANWRVVSSKWSRVIEAPENLQGSLL